MTQPEALRLAKELVRKTWPMLEEQHKAAAELRRLSAENAVLHERHRGDNVEYMRVLAQHDTLLEALKEARWRIANLVGAEGAQGLDRKALDKIDAVIKAVEEGK